MDPIYEKCDPDKIATNDFNRQIISEAADGKTV
jgi:hypothetical protein